MSYILYYSNFCEHSKKLLHNLSKLGVSKDIHYICIDKRTKDKDGRVFITLQNGQNILMPSNVSRVPALLLLTENYNVIYGDDIYIKLKPQVEKEIKQATFNNLEPMAFGFGSFGGYNNSNFIVSDNYSFLDQSDDELSAKGNGGLRQMHNYVGLNETSNLTINCPKDDFDYKIKEGDYNIDNIQKKREQELSNILHN